MRISALALVLVALVTLLALAACGDDDDNDPSGSPDASGDESQTPGGSGGPSGSVAGTPDASRAPIECTSVEETQGLFATVELSNGGQYEPGDPVELTFSLINCGDNETVLHYPTAQRYRFFIEALDGDVTGATVWSSEDGITFDRAEGEEVIDIHEKVSYTETWNQKDRDGVDVAEGFYKVSMFSVGCAQTGQSGCQFGSVRQIEIVAGGGAGADDSSSPLPTG